MRLKPDVQLWVHQREEAEFIKANDKTLLLAGCGVGKTLTVLTTIAEMGYKRSLILTVRTAMRSVWETEIETFTEGAEVLVLDKGNAHNKDFDLLRAFHSKYIDNLIVVVNYESARLLQLGQYDWDIAVADESHKLKSHNSKQSETLARMLMDVPRKVAMTGTAWEDRPTDIFGQVRWLEPVRNGKTWGAARFGSWTRFFEQYVIYREVDNIKIPKSYKNQRELADKIADIFRFVDRDKVLSLPPVTHITRKVRLDPKHMDAYRELRDEMILSGLYNMDEITVDNQMVLALRLHQITGGFYQPDNKAEVQEIANGKAKLEALMGVLDEIGDEPVVIFTRFTEDVNRISAALKKEKISHKVLVGGKDEHMLWQRGKGQVLIANIQAGSAGINLTRACYGIFYSTGYSNTDYTQACARLDRPGQTRPVSFYHIIAEKTIDEEIQAILRGKTKEANNLLRNAQRNMGGFVQLGNVYLVGE